MQKVLGTSHGHLWVVVDLGCGSNPRNPFQSKRVIGVDIIEVAPFRPRSGLEYMRIEPNGRLPFDDNSIDGLTAYDVFEHIPRQGGISNSNCFIELMNEIYRVLRPGGIFLTVTTCYPSSSVFPGPTHVNYITPLTHLYFADEAWGLSLGYGFNGRFVTLKACWFPWVGSWVDHSRVLEETPATKTRLDKILRLGHLGFFSLFKSRKRHFLGLLQKG